MEEELSIDWKRPISNKGLVVFALIFFFVGGFIVGFSCGGYYVQKQWEDYEVKSEPIIPFLLIYNETNGGDNYEDVGNS